MLAKVYVYVLRQHFFLNMKTFTNYYILDIIIKVAKILNINLNLILSRNEKNKQYIKNNNYNLIILKF